MSTQLASWPISSPNPTDRSRGRGGRNVAHCGGTRTTRGISVTVAFRSARVFNAGRSRCPVVLGEGVSEPCVGGRRRSDTARLLDRERGGPGTAGEPQLGVQVGEPVHRFRRRRGHPRRSVRPVDPDPASRDRGDPRRPRVASRVRRTEGLAGARDASQAFPTQAHGPPSIRRQPVTRA
jgi:hypothetical protein